jgi:hypothetical protein
MKYPHVFGLAKRVRVSSSCLGRTPLACTIDPYLIRL